MHPLSVREITGSTEGEPFLDRLLHAGVATLGPERATDLADYLDLAARGGFPEPALRLDEAARRAWSEGYTEQLITRDAPAIAGDRDPEKLRRHLEALALTTAGVVEDKTLYDAVRIDRRTADAYEQLLKNLLILEAAPAWASNRLSRLIRTPKRYLNDPSLVFSALRLDRAAVMRDGNLIGCLIDTFVAAHRPSALSGPEARAHPPAPSSADGINDGPRSTTPGFGVHAVRAGHGLEPTPVDAAHRGDPGPAQIGRDGWPLTVAGMLCDGGPPGASRRVDGLGRRELDLPATMLHQGSGTLCFAVDVCTRRVHV